jgi:Asp-tRNA(Asn)/Glu-tRNA(Gln) amidotransferase A subunit family amidase
MWSITAAAAAIAVGRLSPVELLDDCLQRIDRYEPRVKAWVSVDREGARAAAEQAGREISSGVRRGPLHGIPLGIKDIFDVFDWPTAAGSQLWAHSIARQDATVVRRLREAGAILLGKSVTTQYASFDPPPTTNPWNSSRTPGGSSSGSAAAVATGMCLAALGSQTGGSITRPASYCGVMGCKPTHGRVSCAGVVPLACSMDHPGPIARTVRDLAILLEAIAGADPLDPTCSTRSVPAYATLLGQQQEVPRLGRVRGFFDDVAEPSVREMMDHVAHEFRRAGATVQDVALPASFREVSERHRTVMAVEAASFHGVRLRRHPEDYQPNIRRLVEEGLACPAPDYARCKEHQRRLRAEMRTCFESADVLLTPATTGPAPDAATTGDPAFNSPWSYLGFPTVSLPAAWSPERLPLAIQLVGQPWMEALVFSAAAWCEDVLSFGTPEPPNV